VICEAPTYPGAVPVFLQLSGEVIQIECDADGMRVELLEDELQRLSTAGRRPKIIYNGAELPNPAG